MGLPHPLPDILGLAIRWRPPGTDDVADLLLATTGHTALGRRMLMPTTTWAGMYSSLFPYETSRGRLLLGAVTRPPWAVEANLDALAYAVAVQPLLFDLAVASPGGAWQKFGRLTLTGPARPDFAEPMRFDPVRHPIPGLQPAGWLHQVRGPAYAAAQRVPQYTDKD
ncbi:hypothetical protein ACQPYK_49745 (plasmid) [Streptosporangium sp. CA-135522]|uniref:hypothetical protein n=1 Tax=Streptosporangium sp. CA-135522 TaxID=3240072 RepID=UPI003D8BD325